MQDLVPFVLGMGAADVVLLSVFAVLHHHERREHLRAWSIAFGLDALRMLVVAAELALGGSAVLETTSVLAQTLGSWFLLHGAVRFSSRRTHWGWALATAAVIAWGALASALDLGFTAVHLPTSSFLGVARIAAGVVLLRARASRAGRTIAGLALVLWGVHAWNYPFLRELPSLAPWGFELATFLATCVGIGALLLHLEQARAEERASAARFQELFDGAIEGFFRTSPEGRFLAANPALVRMLGYDSEAELLELDVLRDVYASPADRARVLAHQDGDFAHLEVKRRDGRVIEVALHARRVRDGDGNVRFFEGSMRDVTEEARLREELAQAQRMEALGRMAGGLAHDFNNVLGAIVAATDLARVRLARGDRPDAELDDVRDSAMRAADLTRQLLALARRQPLSPRPIDLREAVVAASRVAGRVIGERIEIEVDAGERPVVVLADRGQIDQVLMNLALNARDAMPSGGALRIRLSHVELHGTLHARLRVEDTGVGMDEATRRHMFDPFFTTKPQGRGNGLGLAMVYGAITQSGGRIEVESAPERGTRIDVLLPLAESAAEAREMASPTTPPQRTARILLVEDEPALRRSIEAALRDAGHDVRAAAHGADALERWGEWPLELLVTDVVMPGLSGPELARAVRERDPLLPVVFVTGYAPEPLAPALSERSELLVKPFTVVALLEAVARRLHERDRGAPSRSGHAISISGEH